MAIGKIFPGDGGNNGFFRGIQRFYHERVKGGEISFFPFETTKTTFGDKNVTGNCQISKSMGVNALPASPSHAHDFSSKNKTSVWCNVNVKADVMLFFYNIILT